MESSGSGTQKAILEMVGRGHTTAEIALRLGAANEKDLQYAASLVKVRDSLRSDKSATAENVISAAA